MAFYTHTTSNLPTEIRTFYDTNLIRNAEPNLVHDQFGQKTNVPLNGGDRVEFRKFSALPTALKPLTEGVAPEGRSLKQEKIVSKLEQYGDYIAMSDKLETTAIDKLILTTTDLLGAQAGRTKDELIANALSAGTNVQYAGGKTGRAQLTANDVLEVNDIRKAVRTLKSNNAIPFSDGYYVCIIHPDVAYDIMNDKKWVNPKEYSDVKGLYRGELGALYGVRFVESTQAVIFDDAMAADLKTLTITSVDSAGKIITILEELTTADISALSGKKCSINKIEYTISGATKNTITISAALPKIEDSYVPYLGMNISKKLTTPVYSTLVFGQNAYSTVDINNGGIQTIIKPLGSGGTADPLDQVSTVGWKMYNAATILSQEFLVRIESCATA